MLGPMERDALRYLFGKGIAALAGVITVGILTRGLGVEAYGRYGVALALAVWVVQLSAGWLQQSILRYRSAYHGQARNGVDELVRRAGTATAGVAAVFAGVLAASFVDPAVALPMALVVGAWVRYVIAVASAQASLRPSAVVLGDALRTLVPLGGYVALLAWLPEGLSLGSVLWILSAGYLSGELAIRGSLAQSERSAGSAAAPSTSAGSIDLGTLLRFGLPYSFWFAFNGVQHLVGRVALDAAGEAAALGVYTAWQDVIARGGGILFLPLTHALHARVMQSWNAGERSEARALVGRGLRWVAVGALATLVGAAILFDGVRFVILGDAPRVAAERGIVLGLIVVEVVGHVSLVLQKRLEVRGKTVALAVRMAGAMLLTTLVTLVFLNSFGTLAVVAGLLVGRLAYLASIGVQPLDRLEERPS